MKFKIRYADQIVGILAISAILALVLTIFLLGSRQRWFARDYNFTTNFESASGMSVGMPLQYKGFTIGKIKKLTLNETNSVDVLFYIFDSFYNRAREGSVVELLVNPIGLGNQFLLHPGIGETLLEEGSCIPRLDSPEGISYVAMGRVIIPRKDDTIANIISQINPFLCTLNQTLVLINEAFDGTGTGPLAQTLDNAAGITGELYTSLDSILSDISSLTQAISDPTGLVPKLIDPDGTLFQSIGNSLQAVEGTLNNIEGASEIMRLKFPQIARLIDDIRIAVLQGQDVLEGLTNNPLLKGGISDRGKMDPAASNSQVIEF
ncbi:MAG TPA: MCE family protein [Treponema sp.]|nr:MCE family protein [Treponema sp.]